MSDTKPERAGSALAHLLIRLRRYRLQSRLLKLDLFYRNRNIEGGNITWYESRNGLPPLVLLHGFLDDAQTFRRALPELIRHYDIIAPDIPGFGGSHIPIARELWDPAVFARILTRFLLSGPLQEHRKNGSKALLLAHSMGGMIGVHMQEYSRHLQGGPIFSRMHLIAPGILKMSISERDHRRRLLFPQNIEDAHLLVDALYGQKAPEIPTMILKGLLYEWSAPGFRYLAENIIDREDEAFFTPLRLKALRTPMTLYWGSADRITPLNYGRRLSRAVSGANLKIIPGGGHALHLDKSEEFLDAFIGAKLRAKIAASASTHGMHSHH